MTSRINPNWYDVDRDLAAKVVSVQNEAMAAFCAAHADRFAAFASVALQFPDLAAQQLEEGIRKLGLRGAAIGGSVAGAELADAKFHPFWAKAEELGAVVFIHPQATGSAALNNRLKGNGLLGNVIGNPILPVIKLCANPRTVRTMGEHIDVDVSGLLRKELSPDQAGDKLIECMFRTANGRLTAAEALGHREFVLTRLYESA